MQKLVKTQHLKDLYGSCYGITKDVDTVEIDGFRVDSVVEYLGHYDHLFTETNKAKDYAKRDAYFWIDKRINNCKNFINDELKELKYNVFNRTEIKRDIDVLQAEIKMLEITRNKFKNCEPNVKLLDPNQEILFNYKAPEVGQTLYVFDVKQPEMFTIKNIESIFNIEIYSANDGVEFSCLVELGDDSVKFNSKAGYSSFGNTEVSDSIVGIQKAIKHVKNDIRCDIRDAKNKIDMIDMGFTKFTKENNIIL